MKKIFLSILLLVINHSLIAQHLKPGFNRSEYVDLLKATVQQSDTPFVNTYVPLPRDMKLVYRSPETGLMNRWDLWLRNDSVAVISIRGTINKFPSWLENFYAPMTPAIGSLMLNDSTKFSYKLADDSAAAVHAGWLLGLSGMAPGIVSQLKSLHQRSGISEVLIIGHSQGGAIAYLLTSYLYYLRENKNLPADFRFKTYCSAAPKPGNLYYAYDYDYITRNGYGYVIINTADWVPESPMTVQTIHDFNKINPLVSAPQTLKKQKLAIRLYGTMVYHKLDRSTRKAQRRLDKYLGRRMQVLVKRNLPQYKEPIYKGSSNYMRAGTAIILTPDAEYKKQFPDDPQKVFMHHLYLPYYSLLMRSDY